MKPLPARPGSAFSVPLAARSKVSALAMDTDVEVLEVSTVLLSVVVKVSVALGQKKDVLSVQMVKEASSTKMPFDPLSIYDPC